MRVEEISAVIEKLKTEFDTHEFINNFIQHYPAEYGKLLQKHNNVATANGEIANYLRKHADILKITKLNESAVSNNIFCHETSNVKWSKL